MNLLEVKQEIGAQLNDPNLEAYDSRAQAAFVRALTSLIKAGDYVPEDIPSLYIMKRNFYLGETLNQNLVATGLKWVASGDFTDTNKALVYKWAASNKVSAVKQPASSRTASGIQNYIYQFTYKCKVVTTPDGTLTAVLKGFSHSNVTLPVTEGWHTVQLLSADAANSAAFNIYFTSGADTNTGEVVFSNLSLTGAPIESFLKLDSLFIDPTQTSPPVVTITMKTLDEVKAIANNSELQPGVEDLFIYRQGNKFYPIVASNSNFDLATDYVTIAGILNIDDSNWSDTTEFSTEGSYLFSNAFVKRAIPIAIQTLIAEVAGE